jgi:hypothetical protein
MISLERRRKETFTFDNYSWTEHICRKIGQWNPDPKAPLKQLAKQGFNITGKESTTKKPAKKRGPKK